MEPEAGGHQFRLYEAGACVEAFIATLTRGVAIW